MLTDKQFATYHRIAAIIITGFVFIGIALTISTVGTKIFVAVITYILAKMIIKKNQNFFKSVL